MAGSRKPDVALSHVLKKIFAIGKLASQST
jgi:hypothetical protein